MLSKLDERINDWSIIWVTLKHSQIKYSILAPNDNNKHNILCSVLMSWLGLCVFDDIERMITLTVITSSSFYCIIYFQKIKQKFVHLTANKAKVHIGRRSHYINTTICYC